MIERYSLPEMADLFSDRQRLAMWLEIELLAVEGWESIGVVPRKDIAQLRRRVPKVTDELVQAVKEREKVTDHDVAAFVDVIQEAMAVPAASWIHYGLTSSDVVDTASGALLARAADLLLEASQALVAELRSAAFREADAVMVGRTHGIHAEPTTLGTKLALWCLQADRDRKRLRAARDAIAVGKLSGAVGTYSNVDPAVEAHVCSKLGLRPVPASQVVARDRHAEYLWACACTGSSIESFATEVRHLQRTEVGEIEEPAVAGEKGSSAMPHKRNPKVCERLCGLARVLRGYLGAGLEDVALWHERDISHSSVERIILPDASFLTYYLLRKMTWVIKGMVVHHDRMRENLERSWGLVFSQPVLLALVASGMERDLAYRIVQRDARAAWEEGKPFRMILEADPDVALGPAELDEAFSLKKSLSHTGRVLEALEDIDA